MNTQSKFVAKLKGDLRRAVEERSASYADIARESGVDTSQVSRVCRGQFKRITGNVLQICKALRLPMEAPKVPLVDPMQRRLEATVLAAWDRTEDDGKRLLRVLRDIADLKKTRT